MHGFVRYRGDNVSKTILSATNSSKNAYETFLREVFKGSSIEVTDDIIKQYYRGFVNYVDMPYKMERNWDIVLNDLYQNTDR